MKKTISLVLIFVIIISMAVPAFAAESIEEYYTIRVEYSDNIGNQESLDVMIQNDNVFVDAKMLAERLGYTFGENDESTVIYNTNASNGLPLGITQFKYNSTQVSHMLFNNMIDAYEAPFASVKNSEGSWIPFEYSLLLLNSGMMITDGAVLIDIPTKRIVDYFFDVAKNSSKYGFDWADDFGYTETDIKVLGGSSHLINVFSGALGFDGASWASLFQQFAGSMDSYDKKYGENLAMLICTESDKELQASTEKVKLLSNLLNADGDLGKLLSFTSDMTDFQVGTLYKQCEAVLNGIKTGNSSAVDYSRAYQALEKALDKQTWFSHTGENILDIQKGVTSATGKSFSVLDVGVKVAEIVGYAKEFQNQDEFSLAAFTHYLESDNSALGLPDAMKTSMIDYSDALSKSIDGYMGKCFLDNIDQWMLDAAKEQVPLHKMLGTQAAVVLIAWDIASKTIPFIANGLSGADNFELALYSMVFQSSAFISYLNKHDFVFADTANITAENMYELSQYCYIYLKSCYITREAALASLANKSSSIKEKIQPLVDYQNSINTEIATIMIELKGANTINDGLVFGFLPSDNEEYLDKYDNTQLVQWILARDLVTDTYAQTYGNVANGGLVAEFNDGIFYILKTGGKGINSQQYTLYCFNNTTGKSVEIASAYYMDSINVVGNYMYYRYENKGDINSYLCKMNIDGTEKTNIISGLFYSPIVIDDWIYFTQFGSISRCRTDGSNKQTIVTYADDRITAFCIVENQLYYVEPLEFATGGFYYGPIHKINLDGSSDVVILKNYVSNERLMSNGELLFFDDDSSTKYMDLDGNQIKEVTGYYMLGINADKENIYSNHEGLHSIDLSSNKSTTIVPGVSPNAIFIVDDWIYYLDTDYTKYFAGTALFKVKKDGSENQQVVPILE